MAEEMRFENERISNFRGLVTLTLDRVIYDMPPSIHQIWNELDARMDINFGPVLLGGLIGVDQKSERIGYRTNKVHLLYCTVQVLCKCV